MSRGQASKSQNRLPELTIYGRYGQEHGDVRATGEGSGVSRCRARLGAPGGNESAGPGRVRGHVSQDVQVAIAAAAGENGVAEDGTRGAAQGVLRAGVSLDSRPVSARTGAGSDGRNWGICLCGPHQEHLPRHNGQEKGCARDEERQAHELLEEGTLDGDGGERESQGGDDPVQLYRHGGDP